MFGGAGAFASAGGGDDAEGAKLVASVLDGDVGFELAGALEVALGDVGDDGTFAFGEVEGFSEALGLQSFFDHSGDF